MAVAVDGRGAGEVALETLLRAETPRLLRIAQSVLKDPQAAEDAVQDTLVLAWRSWDTMRDVDQGASWLIRICVRRSLRVRQSLRRRTEREGSNPEAQVNVAAAADRQSMWDGEHAFRSLSRLQRAVVILHYQHGFSLDECASLVGCRPGTARTHLKRALVKLRAEIVHDEA
jgi:RNA polymerase sigma-70 factor (ECF subfamily)